MRASAAGDVERVLGLMAEDVVFLLPGQPPMRGRETFRVAAGSGVGRGSFGRTDLTPRRAVDRRH